MNSENGKQYFGVGLDSAQLLQDAQKCKDILESIGTQAVQQGGVIDRAFGASGAAHSFSVLEAAIRGAALRIDDIEFGSAEEKVGALSYIVRSNEKLIAEYTEKLNEYKKQAEEAFASGDSAALNSLNQDIDDQIQKIQKLTEETNQYQGALQAVMSEAGMGGSASNMPMLFKSEADIQALEELKTKIAETKAEISHATTAGADTTELTVCLSALNDELNAMELSASNAAAALGTDLGGRAVEAQQNLYQLNTAVAEQQAIVDKLAAALEEAKSKYEELQGSNDASSKQVEIAAATYDTLASSLSNAQAQLGMLQSAQQTAQTQWDNVNQEIKTHDSLMVKMLGGYENYNSIIGKLPAPLQSAIQGIQGMTGAAKAFIATPLGAILAALILAYKTINTWMNSTVEGQLKLAEVSGYLSGIVGQLKEIVISVGKALFKAFSDPKKAISDLWQAIKTNVVNRFKALGDMAGALGKVIKAAFTFDKEGIETGLKELGEGFLQLGTGVEDVTGKVGAWAAGVHDAATETANIKRETKELEIEMSEWQKRNQELEQQKAAAQGKMYNTSLSVEERRKAKDDFEAALNEQIAMETKFVNKKIDLQKRSMALTSNTIEDENKLRDLEAEREAIEANRIRQMASLARRVGSWNNLDARNAEGMNKVADKLIALGDLEASIIIANNKRKIELMEEGHEKSLLELENEKAEEEQAINELEDKLRTANKNAKITDVGTSGLTAFQEEQIAQARAAINEKYQKRAKGLLESELADILTYEQKRTQIQESFQKRRADLYKKDKNGNTTTELRDGVTQGNVDELDKQAEQALQTVDEQFAQRSETYKAWCNQIAKYSLQELEFALIEAQAALDQAEIDGTSGTDLAAAKARVASLKALISQAYSTPTDDSGKTQRSVEEWKELYDVLNDCVDSFEKIGDAIGGVAGEAIKTAGSVAADTASIVNGIIKLSETGTSTIVGVSEAAATAIRAVETASVILAIIAAALQIATKVVQFIKSVKDKEAQEKIDGLQDKVDALQKSYDKLGEAVERAYSKDASKLIEQQNELLKQQQAAIRQQIAIEKSKKDKDVDQERIKRWEEELDRLDTQIADNKEAALDAIFGEDLQSAIENFANSYADAWANGESRATSAKETVKKMMRQMVQESIKAAIQSSDAMLKIRQKLEAFYSDGIFSEEEQKEVLADAERLQQDLDRKFGWVDSLMAGSEAERSGKSGGITTASQESVDELNGRMTAVQGHTYSINESMKQLTGTTALILQSVINIEGNTDRMDNRMAHIESDMSQVKNTVSDLALKGIKIK